MYIYTYVCGIYIADVLPPEVTEDLLEYSSPKLRKQDMNQIYFYPFIRTNNVCYY